MRTRFVSAAVAVAVAALAGACSSQPADMLSPKSSAPSPESSPADTAPAQSETSVETLPSISPVASPPAIRPEIPETQRRAAAASLLMPAAVNYDDALFKLNAGVGGIFIPSWADPGLLTEPGRDIWALRAQVGRPFDVAIDFEGGRVQRFSEILGGFPSPQIMAQGSPAEVEDTAFRIGQTLASHGITVDFAPVLDIDGAGLKVVGDRSFSTDPQRVGDYGAAFARGLQRAGIKPVFKHYPGHGRASGDTHFAPAVTPPLGELFGSDLIPYDIVLPQITGPGVMVGHMVVPGLGDGLSPSSLNPHAYGLLRNHHGFEGIAYTDDLTGMKAITDHFSPDQAVVAALAAGADQALWSTNVDINFIIDRVVEAVANGAIHPQRFAVAHERIERRLNPVG
nr:glycoside hydrolase family 3 N-terminal domain-containing protein [Corynebacterium phocae]